MDYDPWSSNFHLPDWMFTECPLTYTSDEANHQIEGRVNGAPKFF